MARKWSNLNLPGALHYITGNFLDRTPVFTDPACCKVFLDELQKLNRNWPSKLITYVLMPDHLHLIANPRDGRIKEFTGQLKAVSAKAIVRANSRFVFAEADKGHQVWQESFKDVALWKRMDDLAEDQLYPRQSCEGPTITGRAFDRFTHRVTSLWPWIMTGGGRKIPRSCPRR